MILQLTTSILCVKVDPEQDTVGAHAMFSERHGRLVSYRRDYIAGLLMGLQR